MERKINAELLKWKRDCQKKPLFLYGAKQVGKTYSVIDFGKNYYKNIAYFDTFNNLELSDIIKNEKTTDRIIMKLSLLCGESIFKEDTLIVFDNCVDVDFIKALKIFSSVNNTYDVIMISSNRLEINKLRIDEFNYKQMYLLDFEEYLQNSDKIQLIDFIRDSFETNKPMPFHQMALDAYYDYLITGGFPEAVAVKLNENDDLKVESIKQKIIDIYCAEYCKYDSSVATYQKSNEIMSSLSSQLIKDNKKFQYGCIKKGGRSKEYEGNINALVSNMILNRSYRLSDVKSPLSTVRDTESFKLYYNDSGILYSMLHLNRVKFMTNDDIRRTIIENNVANTLSTLGHSLYYYQSDGKAEVSFVIQTRLGKIIPIEVVNMKLTKAKSLSLFLNKYNLKESFRITEDNFSAKKEMRYIPLYATFCLKGL